MDRIEHAVEILFAFLSEHTSFEQLPDADIIFVFGHCDECVAQQAAWLWHMGKAPRIVIAGKGGKGLPTGYETEADHYVSLIIQRGIPAEAILLEKESMNSLENVQQGRGVWKKAGLEPRIIIACAIPPLLRRSCATLRKQCPGVTVHGSAFKMSPDEWDSWARLRRLVGEIDRLKEYAGKGDIEVVDIPDQVLHATQIVRQYCTV
ncbi:MAG: hypothetical protein ACD_81C00069G0002 [uncultured bacterium]|uniref:DUF218 domain-containing protein n=2 Tax=Candidatus Wolfeibacteriota TaxID=1752735 RepID=A0A0G1K4J3_9BACT|nr:MAG: hypothetical protein ACD_81C00069G0002 [uncultured bacterium]KKR13084.1 MAG: hypothetical protein UT41_C0001G0628 [Candidatus Wolfebacteria bacterium GW2011_GWC2_39_22]KKT42754.1 MAG: hypothetical protein UW32_C0004G0059 [Candidatus Wolfebacteria bacterium GW2011_GWE2_44_13]HBI26045.1 hypothetical protein [Candidatus Wolfebacteria bacterium]